MSIRFTIIGATGRMGRELLGMRSQFADLALSGAVCAAGHPALGDDPDTGSGRPASGVMLTSDLHAAIARADVVVDFSTPRATQTTLAACLQLRKPLLIGTTGLEPALQAELAAASGIIPLLVAPNTSLGVTVLLALAEQAAGTLSDAFDVEIGETHHRDKVDAPSGTAIALGRAVASGRGGTLPEPVTLTGIGRRRTGAIGFAVARGGDVVGEHQLRFLGPGEALVLSHIATDRGIFARGALTAARWLASQRPGFYQMADVVRYGAASPSSPGL